MKKKILVVDDNPVDRELVRRLLSEEFALVEADSAASGRQVAEKETPDCALVDFRLPDHSGLELMPDLLRMGIPVIMLSGQGAEEIAVAAVRLGASDYLVKNRLDEDALNKALRYAMERFALVQEVERQAAKIRKSEARLRSFLDAVPIGIYVLDEEGKPFLANKSADALLGRGIDPKVDATDAAASYGAFVAGTEERYPLERLPVVRALSGEKCGVDDLDIRRPDGSTVRVAATASPIWDEQGIIRYSIAAFRDITKEVQLEAEYRQAQKMEAVGRLAGGVAHDFNNVLTAIVSFGGFVLDALVPGSSAHSDMEQVLEAASRAENLIRHLLAFSRKKPVRPTNVNLTELAEQVERMLSRILGEDIELVLDLHDDLWDVQVDIGMFEHALVNLVVNARDAMPDGGRLTLSTRNLRGMLPPDYVELVVADTGVGMDAETRSRAFEPFFTTKGDHGGTGLGLATCYGIVRQAGGRIGIDSAPGQGTTFTIRLPRATADTAPIEALPQSTQAAPTKKACVLLVEDDAQVRRVARRMLERAGHRVLAAADGEAAIELCREHADDIDMVLSDVVMPKMNGRELVERLVELVPGLKVLFMSGYSGPLVDRKGVFESGVFILEKPFDAPTLLARVSETLDSPGLRLSEQRNRVLFVGPSDQKNERVLEAFDTTFEQTVEHALARFEAEDFDLILWELESPSMRGLDRFETARKTEPTVAARSAFLSEGISEEASRAVIARTGCPVLPGPLSREAVELHLDRQTSRREIARSLGEKTPEKPARGRAGLRS